MKTVQVIEAIKAFQKAVNSKKDWTSAYDKLLEIDEDTPFIIGQYFNRTIIMSQSGFWDNLRSGICLENNQKAAAWIYECHNDYLRFLERYEYLTKKADEYMDGFANGTLKYSNSSHRQSAVQKYQACLKEAEKIMDESSIKRITEKIHFLQAG
ncbi:MAG: hypothetical protein ACOYMB_02165 [Patescibacteria group bacterium]